MKQAPVALTAFEKYLLSLPFRHAVDHIRECLANGFSNNSAWKLMAEFNGDNWSVDPEDANLIIAKTLIALSLKSRGEHV